MRLTERWSFPRQVEFAVLLPKMALEPRPELAHHLHHQSQWICHPDCGADACWMHCALASA